MLGTQEILVIALIVLLLFGGKKIPELMNGLGKGIKSFKDGVKGIGEDVEDITLYHISAGEFHCPCTLRQ